MNSKKIIDLALNAGVLKSVRRYGWVLKGVKDAESIADHVFRVVLLTMYISEGKRLNQEKLIKMAIIHDLGKALLGDIIYEHGAKKLGSLKNKYKDERSAFLKIFKNIKNSKKYLSFLDERAAQKTAEAKFLKRVEKLEMTIQALEYEKQGYEPKLFEEFWENAREYLEKTEFEPLFKELEKRRKKHRKSK